MTDKKKITWVQTEDFLAGNLLNFVDPPEEIPEPDLSVEDPGVFEASVAKEFPALTALIQHAHGLNAIVAGGAFKNVFTGTEVKDIDLFFRSQEDWEKAKEILLEREYEPSYENKRVYAVTDPKTGVRLELVGDAYGDVEDLYGTPEDVISRFDFTLTKAALYLSNDHWVFLRHRKFFEHLVLKRLVIDADLVKPFSTFERSLRYTGYGYKLCRESKIKLVTDMQEHGFEDPAQLGASFYDGID